MPMLTIDADAERAALIDRIMLRKADIRREWLKLTPPRRYPPCTRARLEGHTLETLRGLDVIVAEDHAKYCL